MSNEAVVLHGDALETLRELPDECVQTCITSPPYYNLRDYGHGGQIGAEPTPQAYVERIVEVFREVRRVLKKDGTLWLNLGDSYAAGKTGRTDHGSPLGCKAKDLLGIPWMVAFALRADGWYLRQDIIWCLSGGAWVYARTQKGDMPVMVKDLVRLNPASIKLWNGEKWTQVLGWSRNSDPQDKLEIVLRSGERVGCTGDHKWPTQRGNVKARDLRIGDVIDTCTLADSDKPAPGHMTKDAAWFVGLYMAEGSRADDTIQLTLHVDEMPWLERLRGVAKHYGGSLTHTVKGNNLSVRMYGKMLVALLETYVYGRNSKEKCFRTPTWMLPNTLLRPMVQGYLDGDAHDDGVRYRLGFCRNYALERDLRIFAARLGAICVLRTTVAMSNFGLFPAFCGEWRWERSGHHNEKPLGLVVEIRSSRARGFYDIGVEDDPHLFSLASGILTHNCKPNPMPESVRDRCTKAHEYVFMMSKSGRYKFDADAIKEDASDASKKPAGARKDKIVDGPDKGYDGHRTRAGLMRPQEPREKRNRRSVWTITPKPFKGAHFATMPPALVEPCILAGSSPNDIVLDPFSGAGTVGLVALQHGRQYIGIELNADYIQLTDERFQKEGYSLIKDGHEFS